MSLSQFEEAATGIVTAKLLQKQYLQLKSKQLTQKGHHFIADI